MIPEALGAFIDAHSWDGSKEILRTHPELLNESMDEMFELMARFYGMSVASKKGRTLESVLDHQKVIQQCREKGIEAGFAGRVGRKDRPKEVLITSFFWGDDLDQVRKIVEMYPELLVEASDEYIKQVVGSSTSNEQNRKLEERLQLWRRCQKNGVEIAFAFLP